MRNNCSQQQGTQTTLQGWNLLWSGTSSASIVTGSMSNASQQEWRRMSKQFRTCRHAWGILKLTHLASHLHWGHYSLAWTLHQSYCMTLRLQFQMAKLRLRLFCKRWCSQRSSLLLQPSTEIRDRILQVKRSAQVLVLICRWPIWGEPSRGIWYDTAWMSPWKTSTGSQVLMDSVNSGSTQETRSDWKNVWKKGWKLKLVKCRVISYTSLVPAHRSRPFCAGSRSGRVECIS